MQRVGNLSRDTFSCAYCLQRVCAPMSHTSRHHAAHVLQHCFVIRAARSQQHGCANDHRAPCHSHFPILSCHCLIRRYLFFVLHTLGCQLVSQHASCKQLGNEMTITVSLAKCFLKFCALYTHIAGPCVLYVFRTHAANAFPESLCNYLQYAFFIPRQYHVWDDQRWRRACQPLVQHGMFLGRGLPTAATRRWQATTWPAGRGRP